MGKPEGTVEDYLVKQIKALGGTAYKFTSPSRRNAPDRLCVLPGQIIFVECKSATGKLSKGQRRELRRLTDLGQLVATAHSKKEIDALILAIRVNSQFQENK